MLTSVKQQKTADKLIPPSLHKLDGKHHKANGATRASRSRMNPQASTPAEDAAFTEQAAPPFTRHTAHAATAQPDTLVQRGKDLLSADTGSVATAAAVVVGAALIEIELIPGLLIGAGAVLLGKFFPEMGAYVRPAIKGALRAGFSMGQKAREVMAEASEQVHDLVAEVKHEQDQPQPEKKKREHSPAH